MSYSLYIHPELPHRIVKQGWCWSAALLGVLWAIANQLWRVASVLVLMAIMFTLVTSFALISGAAAQMCFLVVSAMTAVVLGEAGNDMVRRQLLRLGYVCAVDQFELAELETVLIANGVSSIQNDAIDASCIADDDEDGEPSAEPLSDTADHTAFASREVESASPTPMPAVKPVSRWIPLSAGVVIAFLVWMLARSM